MYFATVFKKWPPGNPLAVQWLGLWAFTAVGGSGGAGRVQSLVQELRSCKPHGAAKRKKKKKKERKKEKKMASRETSHQNDVWGTMFGFH